MSGNQPNPRRSSITPPKRPVTVSPRRDEQHEMPEPIRIERAERIDHRLAAQAAQAQAEAEARRKYHTAWQEYYQKYYEHYYLAQLETQKREIASTASQDEPELSPRQRTIDNLRHELIKRIGDQAEIAMKSRHFKPILAGVIVVIVCAFIQYNQLFSASVHSLISPGTEGTTGLIIASGNNQPVNQTPTVLIPKINVKAPIIFGLDNLSESSSQKALEQGVINFPVTGANSVPGQNGNTVILGHSSSDVFTAGNYKFIFVQLNRLVPGDLFYIDYGDKRYTYEVSDKKVIAADQLDALNLGNTAPYATLITCDPPGTAWSRLVIIGSQISPNPKSADTSSDSTAEPTKDIPGNPPTLFERLFR
jgi:sortase A